MQATSIHPYLNGFYQLVSGCTQSLFFLEGATLIGPSPIFSKHQTLSKVVLWSMYLRWVPKCFIFKECIYMLKSNSGQNIWDKSAVPLGKSWGTSRQCIGNIFKKNPLPPPPLHPPHEHCGAKTLHHYFWPRLNC
jgi:hypothetical protein